MAQVHAIPSPDDAAMGRGGRRVVYLEDELSVDGDDDMDFGFLSDENFENLQFQGLCANNCGEQALANTYVEAENLTREVCAQAQQPVACAEDVAQVAWPPASAVPYQFARPRSESGASADSSIRAGYNSNYYGSSDYRQGGPSIERYNYAKALLESDEELGRLSLKIRSEILHSEMMELSFEAERAAESGQTSFSGRPSTYSGLRPLRPRSSSRVSLQQRTSSLADGLMSMENRRKIPVLAMRNVTDVIPKWNELHAHMRTHLARRNVDESTLFLGGKAFKKEDDDANTQQSEIPDSSTSKMNNAAHDFAKKSMSFLENLRDLSVLQRAAKSMDPGSPGGCSASLVKIHDDDDNNNNDCGVSQNSVDSTVSGRFGTTLSSHLSQTNGEILKRPKLNIPDGLLREPGADEQTYAEGPKTDIRQPPFSMVFDFEPRRPSSHDADQLYEEQGANGTIETVDTTSSSGSFNGDDRKRIARRRDEESSTPSSDVDAMNPVALFNASEDDCDSICTDSDDQSTSKLILKEVPAPPKVHSQTLTLTPRDDGRSGHKPSSFVTPARLREMRGRRRGTVEESASFTNGNTSDTAGKLSTPETSKFMLEPSSIVDSGIGESPTKREVASLEADKALFLALPSIQSVPSEKLTKNSTEERRFRFPRRRTLEDEFGSVVSGVSSPDRLGLPMLEETSERADSERGNPADSISLQSSATGESFSRSRQWLVLEDPSELLSTNPLWLSSKDRSVSSKQSDDQDGSRKGQKAYEQRQDVISQCHLPDTGKDGTKHDHRTIPIEPLSTGSKNTAREIVSERGGDQERSQGINENVLRSAKEQTVSLDAAIPIPAPKSPESCLIDDASVSSAESSELRQALFRKVEGDRTIWQDAPSLLKKWGGLHTPTPPDLRRVVSWPHPSATAALCGVNNEGTVARPPSDLAIETFAVATSEIISAGAENMCNQGRPNSPGTASFQAAMDMISVFSSNRNESDAFYSESENKEFLNNYFYCGKRGEKPVSRKPEPSDESNMFMDPCVANETLCTIGVENVCNSFNFLFTLGPAARNPTSVTGDADGKALSVGRERESEVDTSDTWLGMLDMASSRFSFSRSSMNESRKRFQPPCLKKICTMTDPQSTPPPRISRSSSRDQAIDKEMDEFVARWAELPRDDPAAESDFRSQYGVSRVQFASMPESDRWGLIETVIDRRRKNGDQD